MVHPRAGTGKLVHLMTRHGIKETLLTGALSAFALGAWTQNGTVPPASPPSLSPVILAENPDVVERGFDVDSEAVRQMVNNCLLKLTSASDIGTAWTRLGITPQDVVGIKITTMGVPTHRPIVQAICDGLQAAGVPVSHIIVWDKMADDMIRAGYPPRASDDLHVGLAAIFPGTGYDPSVVYKNEMLGTLIWGDYDFIRNNTNDDLAEAAREAVKNKAFGGDEANLDPFDMGADAPQTSNRSYYARLVTQICTKIINVPVLCDNSYIGIDGCLGSLALASVDNNRRFQGDPTYGDPAICQILDRNFMRHKVVVHILDALVSQYAGGPRFDPQFTKSIGAIYVSRDPVAIDALVLPRLERWRRSDREGRIDPIGHTASHVHSAASYNLGTDDPNRIQLVRLP
ncbi:MAG TPA: DUF362 domain-containing protein [Candidatus Methylacidiphilales bacterium]|nr:DUF362 domain-containing protein [Candidatus Methylacidiphilales bacterium]